MSQLIAIKPLKEQLAQLIDDGDFQQAKLLLSENINALEQHPAFLFKTNVELNILEFGVEKLISDLALMSSGVDRYLISGVANLSIGRPSDALQELAKGLEIAPIDPMLCHFAGVACIDKGLLNEAVQLFLAPKEKLMSESFIEIARSYVSLNALDLAYSYFEKAFTVLPSDESLLTLLVFMRQQIRSDKLLDWGFVQRIRCLIEQFSAGLINNRRDLLFIEADTLYITGQTADAISKYTEILKSNPNDDEARTTLAYVMLGEGAFKDAYALNPPREQCHKALDHYEGADAVEDWKGQSLKGKNIIVFGEQGLGDRILLVRFVNQVAKALKLKNVTVVIDERLRDILQRTAERNVRYVSSQASKLELNGFDYKTYLSDLLFQVGPPNPPSVGSKAYLKAKALLVKAYQDKYRKLFPKKVTVGITWKSLSDSLGESKNLVLRELGALFNIKGVQWVSLQYGDVSEDIKRFKEDHDVDVYVDPDIDYCSDMESVFAQIKAVDYVITISNATAHICGALGVEASVLISKRPMWHWLTHGNTSCWYKSLKLVRQSSFNTWYRELEFVSDYLCLKYSSLEKLPIITLGEVVALYVTARFDILLEKLESVPLDKLPHQHKSYLAQLYLDAGRTEEATKIVAPLLEGGVTTDQNLYIMAKAGRILGKYDETVTLLKLIKGGEYTTKVILEYLFRALDQNNEEKALKYWTQVLIVEPTIANLDLITSFLFAQREWITKRSYIRPERIDFCFKMIQDFESKFGHRNPVVTIILRAELMSYLGDLDASISGFKKALELRPELSKHFNASLGYALLSAGRLGEGFKRHAAIREVDKNIISASAIRYSNIPKLDQRSFSQGFSGYLLIMCEQGIGDQVLFLQFMQKFLKRFKGKLILTLNPKLIESVGRMLPDILLFSEYESLPEQTLNEVSYQVSIGELPLYVLDKFNDYQADLKWFKASPDKTSFYIEKYRKMFPGKKLIGLSWRSASPSWGTSKDINLESFRTLLENQDVQCISLQYGDVSKEVDTFNYSSNSELYVDDSVDCTNDIEELLSVMDALDAVVTVSNANAHLAGALQKEGCVILKSRSLWHWQHNVEQVPWYPSLQLVRENDFDDTEDLMLKVIDRLKL